MVVSGTKNETVMKRTFKFFAAALAIVAAASCAKENAPADNNENAPSELVEVSFTATIDSPTDPSTKTTLAEDGISVHWTEGDKILLYDFQRFWFHDYFPSELEVSTISEGFAVFSGTAVSATSYGAIYPSAVANTETTSYFVANTLATQTARANNFSTTSWGVANIAMANATAVGEQLTFLNILSHLKFSITSDDVSTIVISAEEMLDKSGNYQSGHNLGGTLQYNSGKNRLYVTSGDNAITLTNASGVFVKGEVYYVALPCIKMKGLTFTFKDADDEVLYTLTKSSTFAPSANTIYNLGSITIPEKEVEPEQDVLDVNMSSINAGKNGGTYEFAVTANNDVTVSESADWLTISYSNGVCTVVADPNKTIEDRTANITVTAGTLSKTVTVSQSCFKYSIVKQISTASELQDGSLYVIQSLGAIYRCWQNDNGKLMLTGSFSTSSTFHLGNVFEYSKISDGGSITAEDSYNYKSSGMWKSLLNNGYVTAAFQIAGTSSTALHVVSANGWSGESGTDIDMYKNASDQTICYNSGDYSLSLKTIANIERNDYRKWYIYEVTEN